MLQVDTMVLIIMVVLVTYRAHADLTIFTSTPTPCYGDVVTLVCHHPDLASNPGRYISATPTWRENGTKITPSTGVYSTTDTSEDLTRTTLNITITLDYFRNKSFNYSCLLVLGENGLPTGGVETSPEVTVDPVELTPPHITTMHSMETSITVRWTPQPCAVRHIVSWMYTNDDDPTTTGSGVSDQVTNYTIPTSVQGVYTVSVQAVDGVGNVGPATSEVVRSTYPRPTTDAPPCENRSLVLTCQVSELHNDRRSRFIWMDRNGNLTNSTLYIISDDWLMIADVGAMSDGKDKAIRCCEVLENIIIVTGEAYMVEPLSICPYTPTEDSEPTTITPAVPVIIAPVIIIVITVIVVLLAGVLAVYCWRRNHGLYTIRQKPDVPLDAPTSGEQTRTVSYAQVGFEDYRPVPAPPVELVTYANPIGVGEREVENNDTEPRLPPKQRHLKSKKFRSDVADTLNTIGLENVIDMETGGVPHFTAEYNGIHFVVTCVYTSSDVTLEDVVHVVEAKQVTGSTKGLLISNQPTIPSECLLTLEDAGCQFVPVSGYGEEGWEVSMMDKVKDVFPKVPDDDSESEDLPTSEQETSLLSDTQSPVIQPRTGLARLLSPVGFAIQKRRNVPSGDWVESEEETTPTRDFRSVSLHPDSESDRLPSPVQISNLSSSDHQFPKHALSRAADDDVKTHNDQFRSPGDTIINAPDSIPMAPVNRLLVSPFECNPSDQEEVFHKRVPWEEVEEEEVVPTPVQETTLTDCPPPSTAASIANLEYPEEPLPTAASVASGECPEMLPMTLTESSHEYSDLSKADDANISPEQTFEDSIISESTDQPPVNQTPTQFSGETYGFLGGLETAQDPSQHQQNWGLLTSKITEWNENEGPPEVIGTTDSTITLTWNTALRCFESEMFSFVVIWNEIGNGTSTNVTTSSSPYTISGLQPGTSYQISVLVMGESGVISNTTVHNVATLAVGETPTGGGDLATAVATAIATAVVIAVVIPVVVFLVIILVTFVMLAILVVACCRETRVRGDYDTGSSAHETSPPPSGDKSSAIQPGTGPTLVQFNNDNNNNITDKRWTMPDEHCVEPREETPPRHNDCSTSTFRGPEDEELTTIVKTESYALDDQNVKGILPKIANNDSESEDLSTPEHVIDSSPMVPPKYLLPPKDSPPPEYQDGYSGVTSDYSKTLDNPVVYSHGCTTTSGQYSVYMSLDTSGLFISSFEHKLSDKEEVFHKRVPQEEVEEEEAVPIPVQETTLTTCSRSLVQPSTAASIANLEYPEEPLPTAASVASGECPEMLPMTPTESSHEYPYVVNSKVEDSNISPEPDSGLGVNISESTTQC